MNRHSFICNINKFFILILFTVSVFLQADPWHPEITHHPRTLYVADDLEGIRGRLSMEPYHSLWYNTLGEYHSIYASAQREIAATSNTQSNPRTYFDKRSWVAKDAAFVYAMNRMADGATDLDGNSDGGTNPWTRDAYMAHAVDYLQTLDPSVVGPTGLTSLQSHGPMINNWQYRVHELIDYCQAYDLLLGAGMATNATIESKIASFANNLLDKYTATEYTNQYLLQRNNHKLTMGAALGMAGIVLNQHNDASDWINAGMLLVEWVCFAEPEQGFDGYNLIDNDGGYAEGTHYMKYAWKKATGFFVAMKNFNGDWTETYSSDGITGYFPSYGTANNLALQNPYFDERYHAIYDWAAKLRLPDGRLPIMEDSYLDIWAPGLAILSPEYDFQFVSDESYHPLIRHLGDTRADYICAGNNHEGAQTEPLDDFLVMPAAGSSVMRNSENKLYLHMNGKNGVARMAAAAHDQADVTHFEIAYQHERMSLEGGYAGWNHRYEINKPENHNVILVNGYGPKPPSGPGFAISWGGFPPVPSLDFNPGEPSPVDGFLENSHQTNHFAYVECRSEYGQTYIRNTSDESIEGQQMWEFDNSDNTNVEFTRCILFVDHQYYIMLDEVDNDGDQTNTYAWRFHANAGGGTDGLVEETPNGAVVTRGDGVHLAVHTETPSGAPTMSYPTDEHGEYDLGAGNFNTHTVIQAEQDAVDTDFLTVLFPYTVNAPMVSSLNSTDDYVAMLVDRDGANGVSNRYEIILAQPGNQTLVMATDTTADGIVLPSVQTSATFVTISLEHGAPIDADHIRVFGKGDEGNQTVTINGVQYDLITDPEGPAPMAHVQFINNDLWHVDLSLNIGTTNQETPDTTISGFGFMDATPFMDVPETMSLQLLEDTTGMDLGQFTFDLNEGEHYIIVFNNDTTTGEIIPVLGAGQVSASSAVMMAMNAFHGVHDAPSLTVSIPELPTPIVDDLAYGEFAGYTEVPAMTYPLDFAFEIEGQPIEFSGDVDLTPYAGSAGLMLASGWIDHNYPENTWVGVQLVHPDGMVEFIDVDLGLDENYIPQSFALHDNYPNPFNPVTHISYDLPNISDVELVIYNMLGQKVKTLVNQQQFPGFKSVIWNGANAFGKPVSAGMYLYQIRADGFTQTRKMILLK